MPLQSNVGAQQTYSVQGIESGTDEEAKQEKRDWIGKREKSSM